VVAHSTDLFVSVGVHGSLRVFDLRSLERSANLYEMPPPKNRPLTDRPTIRPPSPPLLRTAFNPSNPNYMNTYYQDVTDAQVPDMRSPSGPCDGITLPSSTH
jgi:DDB1- and CUL4-associated factor 7